MGAGDGRGGREGIEKERKRQTGLHVVPPVLAVLVLLVLVDDRVRHARVVVPVDLAVVLGLDEVALDLHRVARLARRPGIPFWVSFCAHTSKDGSGLLDSSRYNGLPHQAVLLAQHVQVQLEVDHVVVHVARERIVDVEAVLFVLGVVRALDVPRGAHVDVDGSVDVEDVLEHVVVVAYRRYAPQDQVRVLRDRGVVKRDVPRDWVSRIVLEQAESVGMRVTDFLLVERYVHVGRVRGTVVALHQLERGRPEAVVAVQVRNRGLQRVDGSVVRDCFLKTQLVDDPLALVADVVQLHPSIAGEANVEGKSHCYSQHVQFTCRIQFTYSTRRILPPRQERTASPAAAR